MSKIPKIWKDIFSYASSKIAFAGIIACIVFGIIFICVHYAEGPDDLYSVPVDPAGIEHVDDQPEITLPNNQVNPSQLPDSSFIYDVSIKELANADSYLDGQTVQITGEVVGDRITSEEDGNYCWVVLQSLEGDEEVSVYMTKSMSEMIDTYGVYGKRGTTLQVQGTFFLASDAHQGASELDAEHVTVVNKGETDILPFHPYRMLLGTGLLIVGCILVIVYNYLRERRR